MTAISLPTRRRRKTTDRAHARVRVQALPFPARASAATGQTRAASRAVPAGHTFARSRLAYA